MTLTLRQNKILEGVCKEYIKKASPVSSQSLKSKYRFPFSPATIRSEFACLEENNYLDHPYISSGRIPTDKGFRFLVDKIFEAQPASQREEKNLLEEFFEEIEGGEDFFKISRALLKRLSCLSSALVFAYLPEEEILLKDGWEAVIKEPEFQKPDYLKDFVGIAMAFEQEINGLNCENHSINVYIGKESRFLGGEASLVFTKTFFKDKEGLIAILGPKRMDFERNIGLLNKINGIFDNF